MESSPSIPESSLMSGTPCYLLEIKESQVATRAEYSSEVRSRAPASRPRPAAGEQRAEDLDVEAGTDQHHGPPRGVDREDSAWRSGLLEPVFKLSTFMADSQVPDPPGS